MQVDRHLAERRRKQKKRRGYFWGTAGFLAAYFIVLGVFFFIVRSPAFQAEKITIEGADAYAAGAVSSSTVMNLLEASLVRDADLLSGKNSGMKAMLGFRNLFIWPNALPSSTVAAVPQLAGVTISKNYFLHAVTVTATERQPFAVWCVMPDPASGGSEQCYWFDVTGDAFAHAFDTEGDAIVTIHDYAPDTVAINQPVLPVEFMPNLISVVNAIKTSGLAVQDISLNDISLEQINVTTLHGPTIYFSLRFSSDEYLPVLESLMAKPGFNKLQYVDFTVENRAYYK